MEAYKARFIQEYRELKARADKLNAYMNRIAAVEEYDANAEAPHDCPIRLLERQREAMQEYLDVLEIRAVIEHIDLDVVAYVEEAENGAVE